MVNDPATVFVRRHRGPSGYHDEVFHDDDHVLRTLTKLLDDASSAHRKLDPADGLQDAQLDDGARVHIVHGDVARGGHVLVNIRKFTGIPFASLDELVERGMLTGRVAAFLRACVDARLSIVFAGHPGAGKTTLLSCTAAELDPALRVVVAEEVFEADIPLPNVAHMQTRAARSDREPVDLRRLVAGFLRMAPDVAIVGEVRDREALPEVLSHICMPADEGSRVLSASHTGTWRMLSRLDARNVVELTIAAAQPRCHAHSVAKNAVSHAGRGQPCCRREGPRAPRPGLSRRQRSCRGRRRSPSRSPRRSA
jgi:type IV secretory pathway ATPase VirB11/archaellum biosynthesis ATPase